MGRWEPDARGRLGAAAMELYVERGYEQTTVNDIAERAGLTARTYFRHFADKREVLFQGSEVLLERLVAALDSAAPLATPMQAVAASLDAAAELLGAYPEHSRQRQSVIAANPELRERELIKMASLAGALADGLRRRGVSEPAASLAAEAGIAIFRVAFERWIADDQGLPLVYFMHDSLAQLRGLTTAG